jgi:mannose-1-phosphate guanylyltransferase/mannose-6-phosphate isomerase
MSENLTRFAAILAGGAGTRFWPASRHSKPKPFLDLLGTGPLVRLTAERMEGVVDNKNVLFVLGDHLLSPLAEAIPGLVPDRTIVEPIARNTLGAVLLTVGRLLSTHGDCLVAVFPADHLIRDVATFRRIMHASFALAQDHIVTLGIVPTYPETGYGYIRRTNRTIPVEDTDLTAYMAEQFVEKPDLETATGYLADGRYDWNAGIFFFRAAAFHKLARTVDPLYGTTIDRIIEAFRSSSTTPQDIAEILSPLPNINVDRAIIEQCDNLAVVPSVMGWSDVGTWDAVFEEKPGDASNCSLGDVVVLDSDGCLAAATPGAPMVVVNRLTDVVVVATKDAVLVTRRGEGQKVGDIVRWLADNKRDDLL